MRISRILGIALSGLLLAAGLTTGLRPLRAPRPTRVSAATSATGRVADALEEALFSGVTIAAALAADSTRTAAASDTAAAPPAPTTPIASPADSAGAAPVRPAVPPTDSTRAGAASELPGVTARGASADSTGGPPAASAAAPDSVPAPAAGSGTEKPPAPPAAGEDGRKDEGRKKGKKKGDAKSNPAAQDDDNRTAAAGTPPGRAGSLDDDLIPMSWRPDDYWTLLWSGRWADGIVQAPRLRLREDRGQVTDHVIYDPRLNRIVAERSQKDVDILPPRLFTTTDFAREYTKMTFGRLWPQETKKTLHGGAVESNPNQRVAGGLVNLNLPIELPGAMKSIFGDGPPNLRVSGSERITVGGTSTWRVNDIRTEGRKRSKFPTLEMRQELNVRLNGTIGDKLHIDIAQNSEASSSLDNQIKIYYQGYDDDVIQRVDLGNTNLSLPATQGISYSARQEGLFGVKMTGRLASWDFTAIASKQEGQADVASFSGGSRQTDIGGQDGKIFDYEFERRKYFFILDPDTTEAPPRLINQHIDPTEFAVFVNRNNTTGESRAGEAYEKGIATLYGARDGGPEKTTFFTKMTVNDDYFFSNSEGIIYPYVVLRNALAETYTLAVSYKVRGDSLARDGVTRIPVVRDVGNYFSRVVGADGKLDTLIVKMVRPAKEDQNDRLTEGKWAPTRRLEMKNVYNLGARGIDKESFDLEIHKQGGNDPQSLGSISYLQILGLDLVNNTTGLPLESTDQQGAARGPDGKVDSQYIDYDAGILYFPDLRPFDPSCVDLNGAGKCPDGPNSGGFRAPGRASPRARALGWTLEDDPTAQPPIRGPLYGKYFKRIEDAAQVADEANPAIYDRRDPREDSKKYYLSGSFKALQTDINLQRPGILENSETVRMDNEVLQRGVDYQITYETGQIRLLSDKARNPNGNLQITYSYQPLFARGNKTLAGFATSYNGSENWDFSTTLLYESKSVPELRPKLQQEPTRTFLAGLSGSVKARPWSLTQITDALPLVRTNVPSSVSLSGSLGFSVPNPNTKGDVYLDDMEGVVQTTGASVARETWQYSSRPATERLSPTPDAPLKDTDRMGGLWFSVARQVQARDLSPKLDELEGKDYISTLGIILLPPAPSSAQPWFSLVQPLSATGVDLSEAQYIDVWINDFNRFHGENAFNGLGKELRIDLGRVSEDAVWDPRTPPSPANNRLDFEDQNLDAQRTPLEDLGLDGVDSTFSGGSVKRVPRASPGRVADFRGEPIVPLPEVPRPGGEQTEDDYKIATDKDPAGDDYEFTGTSEDYSGDIRALTRRFRHLNGTENNQRLDSEDLNADFQLNTEDEYFEYTLPLNEDSLTVIDVRKDYNVTDPRNGWRLLRIPLNHPKRRQVGQPDINTIRQLRIWFNGFADTTYLQIASIDIVGNRWERQPIRAGVDSTHNGIPLSDSLQYATKKTFDVAVVNNKQNSEYTPPFAVNRVDRVTEREQSLSLEFKNLEPGEQVSAFRSLLKDEDYTLYQTVSYYLQPRTEPFDKLEFFIRFSSTSNSDTSNVYELATRLDNRNAWRQINLDLSRVSDMKQALLDYQASLPNVPDPKAATDSLLALPNHLNFTRDLGDGMTMRMYGKPSFSQIRRYQVGVRNVGQTPISSAAVWFNELRLGEVRRDIGVTAQTQASVNLGDLATIGAGFNSTDADFLTLGAARGRGTSTRGVNFGLGLNMEKFFPGWNLSLPFRFDTRSSRSVPKFRANDDQIFSGDKAGIDITGSKSTAMSLSLRRNSDPGTPWFLKQTIDALGVSVNYSKGEDKSNTTIDSTLSATGSVSYAMRLGGAPTFRLPGRGVFSPFPNQLSVTYTGGYNETSRTNRTTRNPDGGGARVNKTVGRSSGMQTNLGFRPLSPLTWSLTSQRDLVDNNFASVAQYRPKLKFAGLDLGREVNRSERLQFTQGFNLLGILRPRLTWSGEYTEDHSPRLVQQADRDSLQDQQERGEAFIPLDFKNIANKNSTQVGLSLPLGNFMRRFTTVRSKAAPAATGATGVVPPGGVPPGLTVPDRFAGAPPDLSKPPEDDVVQREEQRRAAEERAAAERAAAGGAASSPVPTLKSTTAADSARAAGRPPGPPPPAPGASSPPPGAGPAAGPAVVPPPPPQPTPPPQAKPEEKKKKEPKPRGGGIGGRRAEPEKPADKAKNAPDGKTDTAPGGTGAPTSGPAGAGAPADSLNGGATPDSTTIPLTPKQLKEMADRRRKEKEAADKAAAAERRKQEEERKKQAQEAAKLAEKNKPKTPGPTLGQLLFRELFQFSDVRTNFSISNSNNVTRVNGTVPLEYRLGLNDRLGDIRRAQFSQQSNSQNRSATANSTVQLLRDISVDAQFQWNDQENQNQGSVTHTRTTTWPSLRFNLSKLEDKLRLRRFFSSFTASSNYERRDELSGNGRVARERSTVSTSWRPFLQFDAGLKNGWRLNFSNDRSSSLLTINQTGQEGQETVTDKSTSAYRMSLAKTLNVRTAGGRNTTIDVNMEMNYSKDVSVTTAPNRDDVTISSDRFQGRLSGNYRFTSTVSGTLQLSVGQTRDIEAHVTDRTIGLQATAAISF